MKKLLILAVLSCLALAPAAALAGGNSYPTVFTAFKYKLDDGDSFFKGQISSTKGNCEKERKVVLYCASGNRSALAAEMLGQMGYRDVSSLSTGFRGWAQAGGEVED